MSPKHKENILSDCSKNSTSGEMCRLKYSPVFNCTINDSEDEVSCYSDSCYTPDSSLWESAVRLSTPFIATVGSQVCSHNTTTEFMSEQKLETLSCSGVPLTVVNQQGHSCITNISISFIPKQRWWAVGAPFHLLLCRSE